MGTMHFDDDGFVSFEEAGTGFAYSGGDHGGLRGWRLRGVTTNGETQQVVDVYLGRLEAAVGGDAANWCRTWMQQHHAGVRMPDASAQ